MFCLMLLLFGAVVFISGTDPKKLKDFINKDDQSDRFTSVPLKSGRVIN